MTQEDKLGLVAQENEDEKRQPNLERIEKRLEMLDHRLDNLDSVTTALVERVMRQPLTIQMTCPNCGQIIEINLVGTGRLGSKG